MPGARLPHLWIRPSAELCLRLPPPVDLSYVPDMSLLDKTTCAYSSLDLCTHDAFTFITETRGADIEQAMSYFKNPPIPFQTAELGKDFHLYDNEKSRFWVDATRLKAGGVVLIRPDQHILALFDKSSLPLDIAKSIASHLGRPIVG